MAQLELRNATVRLIDGHSNTGAVNDTPANGNTELDVDAITGVIPENARFTIVGSSLKHYIVSVTNNEVQRLVVDATSGTYTLGFSAQTTTALNHNSSANDIQTALIALSTIGPAEVLVTLVSTVGNIRTYTIEFLGTLAGANQPAIVATDVDLAGGGDAVTITTLNGGGNTNRITFTPALATASGIPADNAVITFLGRTVEVKIGEGNATYNPQRNIEYVLDGQSLSGVREGDDIPMEVAIDYVWEFLRAANGDPPTVEEAVRQIGAAADWESTDPDECQPYAIDIEIEHVPPCGADVPEIITLPDFRWEGNPHDLREATVQLTGRCNAKDAIVERDE